MLNFWTAKKPVAKNVPPSVPMPWTTANCLALRKFLQSPDGQIFFQRARAMEYNRAIQNARDAVNASHSSGVTVGISDTLNWIESLASNECFQQISGTTADQVENTTAVGDGETDLAEKYSP